MQEKATHANEHTTALLRTIAERDSEISDLCAILRQRELRTRVLRDRLLELEVSITAAKATREVQQRELARHRSEAERQGRRAAHLGASVSAVLSSRSWRITRPVRVAAHVLRLRWIMRSSRRMLNLVGWLLTGQFGRAGRALIPYYQRLPNSLRRRVPDRLRRSVKKRLRAGKPLAEYASRSAVPRPYREHLVRSLFASNVFHPYDMQESYYVLFMKSYVRCRAHRYAGLPQRDLVSIIMPTFNRAKLIGEAIRSVLAQSYTNWELIIVDDCSSDGTAAAVAAFDDRRIIYRRLEKNLGSAGARNVALEIAKGNYITYLDTDNTMDPDFLLVLIHELKANPGVELAYCAQRVFDRDTGDEHERNVRFAPFHWPSVENQNYIDMGTLFHSKALIKRCGGFNSRMRRYADWEFLLRCTAGRGALAVPAVLSNYYSGKAMNQNTRVHSRDDGLAYVDAYAKQYPISKDIPDSSLKDLHQMYSLPYQVPAPAENRRVSIVIPSYEAEAYLHACLQAIRVFTRDRDYEVVIVDNGSGDSVVSYLEELTPQDRVRIIRNSANLGFSHAVNQGIEAASPESDIVILNNDAIVTHGWLAAMQRVLIDYPDTGLVMPSQMVLPREPTLQIHRPDCARSRQCDVNISAHHGNLLDPCFDVSKGYMELVFAPFFCVYMPRSTVREVGLLDAISGPHYRSDRLYCDMVRETGRRILYTPHARVYHLIQRATMDLREKDAEGYKHIYVDNDWAAIRAHADKRGMASTSECRSSRGVERS